MEFIHSLNEGGWLHSCVEVTLALIILFYIPILRIKLSLLIYALVAVCWQVSIPESLTYSMLSWSFFLLESLRYITWIIVLLHLLMLARGAKLPTVWNYGFYLTLAITSSLFIYHFNDYEPFPSPIFGLYLKIILGLFGLVVCEQLIRHEHSSRMTKLVSLVAVTIFAYDIIVFSLLLLNSDLDESLWQARSIISSVTSLILALSIIFYADQLKESSRFKLSNSVIVFNTSLTLVGIFLILIALFASGLDYFDISWLSASKVMLYVVAVFFIMALSLSENIRDSFVVWTSKHFFAHKYDYKKQWIKLDLLLSNKYKNQNCYDTSLHALMTIFNCSAGGVWVKGQQFYTSVATAKIEFTGRFPIEANQSEFIKKLEEEEWIFQVSKYANKYDAQYNGYLPHWLPSIDNGWIVLPLNAASGLIGFAVLCKSNLKEKLTWEDLDLLKLTGRQIASYINQEQVAEKLIQNQQFDMFNKVSAFAIHDIKNLIAQQGLVVKNAEKHKHNPEFVDDAIATIANSVNKMDHLLKKLKGKTETNNKIINLPDILRQAIEMNMNGLPKPILSHSCSSALVDGDSDKLLMALNHLIKNAQDATDDDGTVELNLNCIGQEIWLDIVDSGSGMDQDFIKNKLFQPFNSTKNGEGMGIGAYQIREIIHSLNGELLVESVPQVGSKFSVYLPMVN